MLHQAVVNSARDIRAVIAPIRDKDAPGRGGRSRHAAGALNRFYFGLVLKIMCGLFVPRRVKFIKHNSNNSDDRDDDDVNERAEMRPRESIWRTRLRLVRWRLGVDQRMSENEQRDE